MRRPQNELVAFGSEEKLPQYPPPLKHMKTSVASFLYRDRSKTLEELLPSQGGQHSSLQTEGESYQARAFPCRLFAISKASQFQRSYTSLSPGV